MMKKQPYKYTIGETFVGAGGSHLGFKKNGFTSVFINDIDENCLKTITFNNPEIKKTAYISNESIVDLNGKDILKKCQMKKGDLDVLFGGIVCKGFSLAGERSPADERNNYYQYQLNLVKSLKPKISIIENVPAILNTEILKNTTPTNIKNEVTNLWKSIENYKGRKANARKNNEIDEKLIREGKKLREKKEELINYLRENNYLVSVKNDIENIYKKLGYNVYIDVLNSAWYGACTKRERAIIVAVRTDINKPFHYPKKIYPDESKYRTVGDALLSIKHDLNDVDDIPMNHSKKTIERFKYVKEGENLAKKIDELPEELKISKFYSRGSTMRLDSKKCAPTLVPGHSNFPIHPKLNRVITVREAAAITGFPNDYKFFGSHTKRCEEVGNAVPPALSYAIAKQCKILLDEYYCDK